MDSARHVIKRILNPGFSSLLASHDVASTIHESLVPGSFCSPKCGPATPCPADTHKGATAAGECVLETPGGAYPQHSLFSFAQSVLSLEPHASCIEQRGGGRGWGRRHGGGETALGRRKVIELSQLNTSRCSG